MDLGYYNELFRSALGGRKWILSADVAIAATRSVEWLRELGAPDPFVIAGTTGTGELPDLPDENIALLGTRGTSMMGFEAGVVEPGASAAPVVAAAFALADRLWNTGIGEVAPSVDVRT